LYEREIFDKAGLKLGLDKTILQRMNLVEDEPNQIEQLDDHSEGEIVKTRMQRKKMQFNFSKKGSI
jgi:hypothetical protein